MRLKVGGELFISGTNPSRSVGVRWGGPPMGWVALPVGVTTRREGREVVRSTARVVVASRVEGA